MYHAHFTCRDTEEDIKIFLWTNPGYKLTIIDLSFGGKEQTDFMLTKYYNKDLTEDQVLHRARMESKDLSFLGLHPIRVKVERLGKIEGPLTEEKYLEAHIKTACKEEMYNAVRFLLTSLGEEYGFRLSSNPKERSAGKVHQFANLRVRSGEAESGLKRVSEVVRLIRDHGIEVGLVQIEQNVYDSNTAHDSWWA